MATDKRFDITLGFKSDTTQISKDLDKLEQRLRLMGQGQGIFGGGQVITKEMNIAMDSASKLSSIMQKCRLDNGKLNVAAFKREMENAGISAQSLATQLSTLGPKGVKAFNDIAKAVMNSEVPVRRTQGMLAELGTTLKNTAKWQISSSLLHGFMSSVSHAYNYAQDLNASLNNIKIITKQNTDQMAEFAKQANEAAKSLSVNTTAYTDAALIFYQQGLQGADVTERTDVVAKLSNVTKDSVTDVSSYMTAIWNNFDDGSESLERYADVITGLGAATASSSAEIAAGLEKFAAVADTVGLSYDYATSALATVVAQTRQSADTVGTAFKTMFARIEGLKLGETLDDGVDLNKYSAALQKVGVQILDTNGQLRDMDHILEDMGARWKTLGNTEQVALAQTVAGTRQYNQLVALMDNWDKVQENLNVARSSDGELQAQADVYAQSWEAAQKRVAVAAQKIYSSLIDDQFFIKLANGTEKILSFFGDIIDALGGFKGLWPVFMQGLVKLFSGDIGLNLGNKIAGFKEELDQATGVFQNFKDNFANTTVNISAHVDDESMAKAMAKYREFMQQISQIRAQVDDEDQVTLNLLNDMVIRFSMQIQKLSEAKDALIEARNKAEQNFDTSNTQNAIIGNAEASLLDFKEDAKKAETEAKTKAAQTAEETAQIEQKADKDVAETAQQASEQIVESNKNISDSIKTSADAVTTATEQEKKDLKDLEKTAIDASKIVQDSLKGMRFLFTGKDATYSQQDLELMTVVGGGHFYSKPPKNKDTNKENLFLVNSPQIGGKETSNKLEWAKNNLPSDHIISTEQFIAMATAQKQVTEATQETNAARQQGNEIIDEGNRKTEESIAKTEEKTSVETNDTQVIQNQVDTKNNLIQATEQSAQAEKDRLDTLEAEQTVEEQLNETTTQMTEDQKQKLEELKQLIQELEEYIQNFPTMLKNLQSSYQNISTINGMENMMNKDDMKGSIDNITKYYEKNKIGSGLFDKIDTTELDKALGMSADNIKEKYEAVAIALANIKKEQVDIKANALTEIGQFESIDDKIKQADKDMVQVDQSIQKVNTSAQSTENIGEAVAQDVNQINTNLKQTPEYAQQFSTSFSAVSMHATRFATTLVQIDNLWDQIANGTLTFKSAVPIFSMLALNVRQSALFMGDLYKGLLAVISGEAKDNILAGIKLAIIKRQEKVQARIAALEQVETKNDGEQVVLSNLKGKGEQGSGTGMGIMNKMFGAELTGAASTAAVAAAIALAIAAVAGVTAYVIHKVNMQKLKKEAEKAVADNDAAKERVEKTGEELDAIDSLRDSYASLYDQIQQRTISADEARSSAIKLAAEYENENLMVLALTEQYSKLNDEIVRAQELKRAEHLENVQKAIETGRTALIANATYEMGSGVDTSIGQVWNNFKPFMIPTLLAGPQGIGVEAIRKTVTGEWDQMKWGDTRDLGHGEKKETAKAIEDLLGDSFQGFLKGTTELTDKDFNNIFEMAAKDPEAFNDFMISLNKAAAAGEKPAQKLREIISENNELINQLKEQQAEEQVLINETAFNNQYNQYSKSLTPEQYSDLFSQAVAKGADIESIVSQSAANANTQETAAYGATALSYAKNQGWDLDNKEVKDKIAKIVDGLTKEFDGKEVATLALNVQLTGAMIDENGNVNVSKLEELGLSKENLSDVATLNEKKNNIDRRNALLDEYDASKGWTDKQKVELTDLGYNTHASALEILEQLGKDNEADIKTYDELHDKINKTREALEDLYKVQHNHIEDRDNYGLSDELLQKSGFNDVNLAGGDSENELGRAANKVGELSLSGDVNAHQIITEDDLNTLKEYNEEYATLIEYSGEELDEGLNGLAGRIAETLPDSTEEFEKELEEIVSKFDDLDEDGQKALKDTVRAFKTAQNAGKRFTKELDAINIALADIGDHSKDSGKKIKYYEDRVKTASAEMDNMQKSYKSLKTIEAQYAEDKFLTVDSFQEILDMEPKYLNALKFENGQLKVNEQTLQEVAIARVRDMEAKQADAMWAELDALANGELKKEEIEEIQTKYLSIAANEIAGHTMAQVEAQARALAKANTELASTYNAIAQAASNYAAAAGATIKGLQTNFPKAMGYSPKGGGGKKGKEKEEKDLKEYADEFDRFYPLQKVIDDLADAISDLAKQQEHLAGGELVGSLHKQNKLLQQQKKAYQDLMKEQKLYQKEMQTDLAKYGMSFEIASGNIVNYTEATKAMLDEYNAAIEKYNKSAQEDADKKALEAVEKEYEKFKKLVSDYQGILTEIQDTENELDDIYYETIANNLKEFEIMVEVKLDIGEARRMVNDFVKEINQNFKTLRKTTSEWLDVFESALANAKTYTEGDLGTVNVDLDAYNKVKNAIDSGDYGHEGAMFASETEAITKLKELGEQLKDDSMDLYNIWKDAWEDYIDAVDETLDQWEDLMDGFDDINDELDHWEKITELVRKAGDQENDYQVYLDIYDKKMQNEEQRQIALNRQIDALEREYKQLIESGASELDEDVQKIKEKMDEASKALYDSLETYLEALNNRYDKQFEYENKKSIEQALGFSIDEMTTQWDRAKKAEEGYYDANQRIYQLDKLRRKYTEAINNTDDLKYKQKLAKMQEAELKGLEEKKALSEGDLQIAEKKLAVQQAQIALEEARDNRSQMRLQRDSQGNWSYQFVADEGNIEDKKQALMDAANELYETVKKNEEESIESLRNIYNTWLEERQNLSRESFESDDAYLEALEELDKYYKGLIETRIGTLNGYRREQNQATSELLLASYTVNEENYGKMTEAQQKLIDELKEHNIKDMADITTATDEDYEAIRQKAEEVNQQSIAWWDRLAEMCAIDTEQMAEANENFYNFVRSLLDQYNADVEAARDASRLAIDDVGSAVEDLGNKITDVADRVDDLVARTDQLSEFRERVNAIEEAWMSVKDSIMDALGALNEYMKRLLDVREMQEEIKRNEVTDASFDVIKVNPSKSSGDEGNSSGSIPSSNSQPITTKQNPNYKLKFINYSYWDQANHQWETPSRSEINDLTYDRAQELYEYNMEREHKGSVRVEHYKSGGYTGDWSDQTSEQDNGKLAWLHQKELILNANDTQNILDAVELVRSMNNSNSEFLHYIADSIAAAAEQIVQTLEYGMHSVLDRVMYTSEVMASAAHSQRETVIPDQNVHIDASFPNVQSSFEIETALNNLVNVASQRTLSSERFLY